MPELKNNNVTLGVIYMCVAMLGGTSIDIAALTRVSWPW